MILLDTNIVSEGFKGQPSAAALGWLNAQDPMDLYISVVTVAEMFTGIETMPKGFRQTAFRRFTERDLMPLFEGRVLPFDEAAARELARIAAISQAKGRKVKFDDGAIAAIAQVHGMTVATRNVRHFEPTGVPFVNPWLWTP